VGRATAKTKAGREVRQLQRAAAFTEGAKEFIFEPKNGQEKGANHGHLWRKTIPGKGIARLPRPPRQLESEDQQKMSQ